MQKQFFIAICRNPITSLEYWLQALISKIASNTKTGFLKKKSIFSQKLAHHFFAQCTVHTEYYKKINISNTREGHYSKAEDTIRKNIVKNLIRLRIRFTHSTSIL